MGTVDDTWVRYRPLFSDPQIVTGSNYFYRVSANNPAGTSAPSNVVGPVTVTGQYLIDELIDFSKIFAHSEMLTAESANARPYKEDPHRLKGTSGDWLVYKLPVPLKTATVLALADNGKKPLRFSYSTDNKTFKDIDAVAVQYPNGINLYGYKLPLKYQIIAAHLNVFYLKIEFSGDMQISRVDLRLDK